MRPLVQGAPAVLNHRPLLLVQGAPQGLQLPEVQLAPTVQALLQGLERLWPLLALVVPMDRKAPEGLRVQ